MGSNHSHYLMLLKDQKWLTESDQAAAHLALTLKNLPNCVDVGITDLPWDSNRSFQKSHAEQLLITEMKLPTSFDFVEHLISTTMAAVNVSGCTLENFYIGHEMKGIQIQQLPRLSSSQLDLPFLKLTSLWLCIDSNFYDTEDYGTAYLFDWIKLFPSLRTLKLAFSSCLSRAEFSSISRNLHFDNITTLILSFMNCDYDDLAFLLRRRPVVLRRIILDQIDLTGSWRSILNIIRDETLIDSVEITDCTSNHRDISFEAYSQDEPSEHRFTIIQCGGNRWICHVPTARDKYIRPYLHS